MRAALPGADGRDGRLHPRRRQGSGAGPAARRRRRLTASGGWTWWSATRAGPRPRRPPPRRPPAARQGHRAEPDRAAARRPGRQRRDAGPARGRLDHHDRQRERHAALAGHRRATARPRRACTTSATSLAVEWAPKVRVNSVVPGPVATESAAAAHYRDVRRVGRGRPDGAAGPAGHPGRRGGRLPVPGLAAGGLGQRCFLLLHGGGERR